MPAFILCSSGTTGSPKSILVSHAYLTYMLQNDYGLPNNVQSVALSFSSLYWISGIVNLLMSTLNNNVRVVVGQPFTAPLLLEIIKTRKVGSLICPAAQLQLLRREKYEDSDLQSLRNICTGGAAVPESLAGEFPVPVLNVYGLTEVGVVSVSGFLTCGMLLKIVDEDGKKLGVGERGEICLRPPVPFLGYCGNEEASREILRDGFVHSGDIGVVDAKGCLHVVDRKKDIFKFNNFHISPSDVERELQGMAGISLVTVVAIPNDIYAALPAAIVVRSEGSLITEADVHKYAKLHLAHYKWLRGGVYFVEKLLMTISGKVRRGEMTKIAAKKYEETPDIGFVY